MENKELAPTVLANDFENVSDILAGSEELANGYTPRNCMHWRWRSSLQRVLH